MSNFFIGLATVVFLAIWFVLWKRDWKNGEEGE